MQEVMQDIYTTEQLKRRYFNLFDMANYAIELGRNSIRQGNPMSLMEILDELEEKAIDKEIAETP